VMGCARFMSDYGRVRRGEWCWHFATSVRGMNFGR
jgi:hypothetical protein